MVKFLNVINRGEDEELLVIANREDLPVGILKIIASRNGYDVAEVSSEGSVVRARLKKVR